MFASKWILTLFACRCDVETTSRIFDWFLLERWEGILNICLVILLQFEEKLSKLKFEEILVFLETAPEKLGIDVLLENVKSSSSQNQLFLFFDKVIPWL